MFHVDLVKSRTARYLSIAILVAAVAVPLSSTTAYANQNEIQLDISSSFDWSAASIRKLAFNTAHVFSRRCKISCTVSVRVMIRGNAQRVSNQRLQWLRQNLTDEMGKKTDATVVVLDRLLFV